MSQVNTPSQSVRNSEESIFFQYNVVPKLYYVPVV